MPQNHSLFLPFQQCFPQIFFPCGIVKRPLSPTDTRDLSPVQMALRSLAVASGTLQNRAGRFSLKLKVNRTLWGVLDVQDPELRHFEKRKLKDASYLGFSILVTDQQENSR